MLRIFRHSGFTPLPFNLLAITSGFVGFNFFLFAATALFTRTSRYFLLTYLFSKYGPKIQRQIDKNFASFVMWVIGSFAVVIAEGNIFSIPIPNRNSRGIYE